MGYTASFTYTARDKFSAPLNKIKKAAEQLRRSLRQTGRVFSRLSGQMGNARRMSEQFQKAMNMKASPNAFREMSNTIKKLRSEIRKIKAEVKSYSDKIRAAGDRSDKTARKINLLSRAFGTVRNKAKAAGDSLNRTASGMASLGGLAGGVMAAVGGKAALDTFVSFDSSMNTLQATTFASAKQMQAFRDMAKKMGAETQFSAGQAAQGMTMLAMAGLDQSQIMAAIPKTLQLAAAGNISLAEAADISTNVMGMMGLKVKDLSGINDLLAYSQSKANFNIKELYEALRPIGATATNLGMDLHTLTASLGIMANAGEKGSIAGTLFRNALTRIAGATPKQKAIYKSLGIELSNFVTKSGKLKNFDKFIAKLKELVGQGKLTVPMLKSLYGEQGFRAIQVLTGKAAKSISEMKEEMGDFSGKAETAANIHMKGLPGVLKSWASAFEAVQIAFFESGVDQILIDLFTYITKIARSVSSANPTLLKMAGTAILIIGAVAPLVAILGTMIAVAGGAMTAIGAFAGILGTTAGVVIGVSAAVAGTVVAIGALLAGIVWFVSDLDTNLMACKLMFSDMGDWAVRVFNDLKAWLGNWAKFLSADLGSMFAKIGNCFEDMFESGKAKLAATTQFFADLGAAIKVAFMAEMENFKIAFMAVFNMLPESLQALPLQVMETAIQVKDAFLGQFDILKAGILEGVEWIKGVIEGILQTFQNTVGKVKETYSKVTGAIGSVKEKGAKLKNKVVGGFKEFFGMSEKPEVKKQVMAVNEMRKNAHAAVLPIKKGNITTNQVTSNVRHDRAVMNRNLTTISNQYVANSGKEGITSPTMGVPVKFSGSITVKAAPGAQVEQSEITTRVPGQLGTNIAGS